MTGPRDLLRPLPVFRMLAIIGVVVYAGAIVCLLYAVTR